MMKWVLSALCALALATTAVAQGYQIKEGDQLRVEVLEDTSLNRAISVLPDGSINFPLAGTIQAKGLTVGQLTAALTEKLAPNFASAPSVFVSVAAIAPAPAPRSSGTVARSSKIDVFLIGEVNQPGLHEVEAGTTLLQFFAQTGGFNKFAAKKRIQLRRTNADGVEKIYRIDYRRVEQGQNVAAAMAQLREGDVIVVPERRLFE